MSLAVALIPSNQDGNLGAIEGYSEAGGCQILADKLEELLSAQGIAIEQFIPTLESQDDASHTFLKRMMQQARRWLDQHARDGYTVAALHIHTNAASDPRAGIPHTGYCWFAGCPGSRELGEAIAERVGRVLDLPVIAYDYSGLSYLADVLFAPLPSVILEITRHDRRADLERLYQTVDVVSTAVVEGLLAWAGEPAGTDEAAQLRAENERLRQRLAQIAQLATTQP